MEREVKYSYTSGKIQPDPSQADRLRVPDAIRLVKCSMIFRGTPPPRNRIPSSMFLLKASPVRFALEMIAASSMTAHFAWSFPGFPHSFRSRFEIGQQKIRARPTRFTGNADFASKLS